MITVVGIGISGGEISTRGKKAIKAADEIYSRGKTRYRSQPFSIIFNEAESFEELDEKIVDFLMEKGKDKNVAFLSVGDGFTDTAIKKLAAKAEVVIIPGVADSRAKKCCSSCMTLSAYDIEPTTIIDTRFPLSVYQIDDKFMASDVKLFLMKFYPEDYSVTLASGKEVTETTLSEIDHAKIKQGSSIFLTASEDLISKKRYGFSDLMYIMARLIAPDGCPWDRAQTHESICINMIEEAYEAVDAIKRGDVENMREEFGDVILQSVFNAVMSEKEGDFDVNDVISDLCCKLVMRHTHIFGDNKAGNAEEALGFWEQAKAKEKSYSTFKEQIDRLPDTFPGTLMLQKFIKKANKSGAEVNEETLKEKIRLYLDKNDPESLKKLLADAVMLAAVKGGDPEVMLLDEFARLKKIAGSDKLNKDVAENL